MGQKTQQTWPSLFFCWLLRGGHGHRRPQPGRAGIWSNGGQQEQLATWSFDVHPRCGYISKKAKVSKVNHGGKALGLFGQEWNRAENEWLPGSVCWYCSLGVSSTCPWYRELPKTCQGRWSWRLAFKFQVHSPKNTFCGMCVINISSDDWTQCPSL